MASVVPIRRPGEAPPTDAGLTARSLAGDAAAREALFVRHAPGVLQMADRVVLRDPVEAEDVVQHTFEVALRDLHELESASSLRAWLLQIAVRR